MKLTHIRGMMKYIFGMNVMSKYCEHCGCDLPYWSDEFFIRSTGEIVCEDCYEDEMEREYEEYRFQQERDRYIDFPDDDDGYWEDDE